MKRINKKYLPWLNGLLSAALMYVVIPMCFARGVPDFIWISLIFLLPLVPAVWLLYFVDRQPPKAVFTGFWVEFLIATILHRPLGSMWGYQLNSIQWDLFDFIAYFMQFIGFALGATLVQFVILWLMHKESKGGS